MRGIVIEPHLYISALGFSCLYPIGWCLGAAMGVYITVALGSIARWPVKHCYIQRAGHASLPAEIIRCATDVIIQLAENGPYRHAQVIGQTKPGTGQAFCEYGAYMGWVHHRGKIRNNIGAIR